MKDIIDWSQVNTLLLDMDGTLLDLRFDNHFWREYLPKQYSEEKSVSLDESKQHLQSLFITHQGTLNWYCLDFWSEQLAMDLVEHKNKLREGIQLRPNVEWFLQEARNHVTNIALVTNAHQDTLQIKLDKTGISSFFDKIICSHDIGLPKEDPSFWSKMQKELPFDSRHSVFIDDSLPVLDSAKSFGIRYVIGVLMPDSQGPKVLTERYPLVDSFADLIPITD
ncbi:MAG: GMP/IMP nucleotidase [Pseudomonadota bacterium]